MFFEGLAGHANEVLMLAVLEGGNVFRGQNVGLFCNCNCGINIIACAHADVDAGLAAGVHSVSNAWSQRVHQGEDTNHGQTVFDALLARLEVVRIVSHSLKVVV